MKYFLKRALQIFWLSVPALTVLDAWLYFIFDTTILNWNGERIQIAGAWTFLLVVLFFAIHLHDAETERKKAL